MTGKRVVKYFCHEFPLWVIGMLTNWWPDNRVGIRLRGMLVSPFLGKAGKRLTLSKDVTFLRPDRIAVGDDVYFARGVWIEGSGGVTFEDEVMVGPYAVIVSNNHGFKDNSAFRGGTYRAPISVGRGTWLSAHVVIVAGVNVGKGNLVGANAVVTKSTPDNVLVAGVPAKVLGPRRDAPGDADRPPAPSPAAR